MFSWVKEGDTACMVEWFFNTVLNCFWSKATTEVILHKKSIMLCMTQGDVKLIKQAFTSLPQVNNGNEGQIFTAQYFVFLHT